MRIHDNAPTNWHDEIASWFPTWYQNVLEMDALWRTWGVLLDRLQADIQRVLDNFFLTRCDEETIEFWEEFMNIKLAVQHSLEYRRRYIMTHFSGFGKCSATQIKNVIRQYTGSGASVSFEKCDLDGNHELIIIMENGEVEDMYLQDLQSILEKIIPAHIPVTIRVNKEESTATGYPMTAMTSMDGSMHVTAENYG